MCLSYIFLRSQKVFAGLLVNECRAAAKVNGCQPRCNCCEWQLSGMRLAPQQRRSVAKKQFERIFSNSIGTFMNHTMRSILTCIKIIVVIIILYGWNVWSIWEEMHNWISLNMHQLYSFHIGVGHMNRPSLQMINLNSHYMLYKYVSSIFHFHMQCILPIYVCTVYAIIHSCFATNSVLNIIQCPYDSWRTLKIYRIRS